MSNPFCLQPDPAVNQCEVNIRYWQATDNGAGNILAYVNFSLNGKLGIYVGGFFEATAYLANPMAPGDLLVTCGRPNASGKPNYGKAYSLVANAYKADGISASDLKTVFCPAYDGAMYLPLIRKYWGGRDR